MRILLLSFGLALLLESSANACPLPCAPVLLPSSSFAEVPANLPGFPFRPPKAGEADADVSQDAGIDELELLNSQGFIVPTTRSLSGDGFSLLVPTAQLDPGGYVLRYLRCTPNGPGLASEDRFVHVAEVAPFPTPSAGDLRVRNLQSLLGVSIDATTEKCSMSIHVAMASLSVAPSSTLMRWLPLISWTVTVDGKGWAGPRLNGVSDPLTLFAFCGDASAALDEALSEGAHHVIAVPHIHGAPDLPPLSMDVDLGCSPLGPNDGYSPSQPNVEPTGSFPQPGPPASNGSAHDGGIGGVPGPGPGSDDGGSGCNIPRAGDLSTGAGTLLVLVTAMRARWRARRTRRSPE